MLFVLAQNLEVESKILLRLLYQTIMRLRGLSVLRPHATVVSRWFVIPRVTCERKKHRDHEYDLTNNFDALLRPAKLLEFNARLVDTGIAALHDLLRVVLMPAWFRIILWKFDLVRRDNIGVTVEDHEPCRPAHNVSIWECSLLENRGQTLCHSRESPQIRHV